MHIGVEPPVTFPPTDKGLTVKSQAKADSALDRAPGRDPRNGNRPRRSPAPGGDGELWRAVARSRISSASRSVQSAPRLRGCIKPRVCASGRGHGRMHRARLRTMSLATLVDGVSRRRAGRPRSRPSRRAADVLDAGRGHVCFMPTLSARRPAA